MNISNSLCYAFGVSAAAVAILAGCSNGGSPSSFAPSGATSEQKRYSSRGRRPNPRKRHSVLRRQTRTFGGNYSAARGSTIAAGSPARPTLRGNKVTHAALWRAGRKTDLGTLGGPNSLNGFDHNTRGVIAGVSESSQTDPYSEDWCWKLLLTSHIALGFRWQKGVMTPLPTLGGNNSVAPDVNNRDQIIGEAETSTQEPTLPQTPSLRLLRRDLAAERHDGHAASVLRRYRLFCELNQQ